MQLLVREKRAIRKLIEQGTPEEVVMKSYAINKEELKEILEKHYETRFLTIKDEETIKLMHQQGKSIKEIAGELCVCDETVARRLRKYPDYVNQRVSKESQKLMAQLYRNNQSVKDIAKWMNLTKVTVYKYLQKQNVFQKRRTFTHLKKAEIEQIIQKYKEGKSKPQIARELNRDPNTIYRIIDRYMRKNE